MRSAQRRERKNKLGKRKVSRVYIFIFVVFAFLLWFFVISAHFWDDRDKMAVTVKRENGDASVIVFDPKLDEITTLTIPGDTEVTVARNLGVLRLKNVWQLGINEHIGGKLLTETLTNNFGFASYLYTDKDPFSSVSFLFTPGKTNLSFRDRLSIVSFASKIGNPGRTEINLGKSLFLQKTKLSDGEVGYKPSQNLTERLTIYFSDYKLAENNVRVFIKDGTGKGGVAIAFGKIVEIMGAKVVSIDKVEIVSNDCTVNGEDKEIAAKIGRVFSCKVGKGKEKDVLTIELGREFAKRF